MARAAEEHAEPLARAAVEETGYGVEADKVQKNLFAARNVHAFIRPMATVGVIARHEDRRVLDIAEPFGPVAAIVPSTNPTSTTIYKLLIALKARCAIVLSPHPAAQRCITRTAEVLAAAAREAGAPDGAISWLATVSVAGTQALMRSREVAVILATGGLGLVRAAYSAGKPAYGVGPGNAPAYIESSADVPKAVRDIITGKTFDNGLLCSSENAVVVDAAIAGAVRDEFRTAGGHFLSAPECAALAAALVTPQRLPHPDLVGRSALEVARRAGIVVPPGDPARSSRRSPGSVAAIRSRSRGSFLPFSTASASGSTASRCATTRMPISGWARSPIPIPPGGGRPSISPGAASTRSPRWAGR